MAAETIDTLVIGAGQSGLAMSHALAGSGRAHLVLERGRVGERWLSERWDSLAFQFPNWSLELPGLPYPGGPPDGFARGAEIAGFIDDYARHIAAPVRTGVTVRRLGATALDAKQGGFLAETSAGVFRATNVVVATGPYQRPAIPAAAADLEGVFQLHASAYRNPGQLPAGGVLVVGAGASGAQIAEDLVRAGRPVWLAVGSHRRAPRRYRGWDFHFWAFEIGEWDRPTAERVAGEPPPLLTGVDGGRDMDLRELAAMGVTLTGRLAGVEGGVARFKPDLAESLARGDAYLERFWDDVDAHVARTGLAVEPAERAPRRSDPACVARPLAELDLAQAGVSTVLWASGYGLDLGWIDLPVVTPDGGAIHEGGVSPVPGLYFLGLPWLTSRKSTVLSEVGADARRLAAHIAARA